MSPRLNRVWLGLPFLLFVAQAWALGLGDIRLSSGLNQPLRAEIELLAATPEELNNLSVQLASMETFRRYDLDRPMYLTGMQFEIVKSGRADGNFIRVMSSEPITEPFITFLVEANWSRGRLLREYTLLLDPPTFAPPPTTQAQEAVTAPTRAAPADAGEIQRPAPQQQAAPPPRPAVQAPVQTPSAEPAPQPAPQPAPAPAATEPADTFGQPDFDTSSGGDIVVQRGDTLWGITQRVRPDSRLTINQTMLAIYEANPGAFDGNINRLRAGATLRIPSADDVFRISRADAFSAVVQHNAEWRGEAPPAPAPAPAPIADPVETQPSLTLVPPDEEDELTPSDTSADTTTAEAVDEAVDEFVDPVEQRITEIESILEDQDALIEIPDNELAALRQELSELRGEELRDEELFVDDQEVIAEDQAPVEEAVDEVAMPAPDTTPAVVTRPASQDDGIVDTILGYLNNFWVWIGAALVATFAILAWFMRRAARRDDEEATGVWDALDADEMAVGEFAATGRMTAPSPDEDDSFVVVETESTDHSPLGDLADTMEAPAPEEASPEVQETMEMTAAPLVTEAPAEDSLAETGTHDALEDTFSSETAVNLDQSDPVAEADFHMAYGLYDQAADLINGALTAEPDRQDLLAKLCEIYFVWGNRDAFVDAATRLKGNVGGEANAEWDKIVIMGQQIAADHELFSGVSAEGVTKAVDLSFDVTSDEAVDLDMDFAGQEAEASDVIDLGTEEEGDVVDLGGMVEEGVVGDETGQVLITPDTGSGIDFSLDDEPDIGASATREMPERIVEATADDGTAEMSAGEETFGETTQAASEDSVRTPTIEQQFEMDATGEMPTVEEPEKPEIPPADATAEIDLDDLGLDLDAIEDTALGVDIEDEESLGDLDDTESGEKLEMDDQSEITGQNVEMPDLDALAETGRNEGIDEVVDDLETTGSREVADIEASLAATNEMPMADATGMNPALTDDADATGINRALADDDATQLASLDDFEGEDTDVGLDTSLLDATGQTQILTEDMAVETAADIGASLSDADATMLAPGYGDEEETAAPISDEAATMLAPMDEDEGDFDFAKTEALPKDVFSPDMSTDDTGRLPGLAGSTDMDLDLDDLTAALKVSEVGDTVNQLRDDATVEQPRISPDAAAEDTAATGVTQSISPDDLSGDLHEARTMTEVGTKLDLARAYVDMGDPAGARSILEEVLDEGDEGQKQQAQQLIDSLPG